MNLWIAVAVLAVNVVGMTVLVVYTTRLRNAACAQSKAAQDRLDRAEARLPDLYVGNWM